MASGERLALDWTARDESGTPLPSGVYLLRARLGDEVIGRKLVLLE